MGNLAYIVLGNVFFCSFPLSVFRRIEEDSFNLFKFRSGESCGPTGIYIAILV